MCRDGGQVVTEGLSEEVRFQQRPESAESEPLSIRGGRGQGNRKCKDLRALAWGVCGAAGKPM